MPVEFCARLVCELKKTCMRTTVQDGCRRRFITLYILYIKACMRTTVQDGCRWRCIRLCRLARPGWWRHLVPERPRASLHCPTMQGDEDALEEDRDALDGYHGCDGDHNDL